MFEAVNMQAKMLLLNLRMETTLMQTHPVDAKDPSQAKSTILTN